MPHLTSADEQAIVAAIAAAERRTSGEIRVHLEKNTPPERAYAEAVRWFEKLKMHQTQERNGILFFLSLETRSFAVIGDSGIHAKVGDAFWIEVREAALAHFRQGELGAGLVAAIHLCGEQLRTHFPFDANTDQNELTDEISRNG